MHFQITDLCDAASDEDKRQVLEHLPDGLNDTYTRIFAKIAQSVSKATVLKIMMWMTCARRPLRVGELQEAVAFDLSDKEWSIDRIPNGDQIIRSCHGLVVRDSDDGQVRLAHHTVKQYLVSPQESARGTSSIPGAHIWPELQNFRCDPGSAEKMAGRLCIIYLSFSDFETNVGFKKRIDLTAAFKDRGPVSIPTALGLGKYLHKIPYKFFGSEKHFKMPDIDYPKYLIINSRDQRLPTEIKNKYSLLEYVIEHWGWHTRRVSKSDGLEQLLNLIQHKVLPFEFRPWGPNQHFGPIGCKGCPVPDSDDFEPKDLASMAFLHWAAEIGHLSVFNMIEPSLQEYLEHEQHHDETLSIACRHGQTAFVELLLGQRTFDLSDGRAIQIASGSGNASTLDVLLKTKVVAPTLMQGPDFSSRLSEICVRALHQAASHGQNDIVKVMLANNVRPDVTDDVTGLTSFEAAVKNGHLQVIREFFTANAGVLFSNECPGEKTGTRAIHCAAANGHEQIVRFFVQHGLGCDVQNVLGETALIKAAQNGHATVATVLLELGADPLITGGEPMSLAYLEPDPRIKYLTKDSYGELCQPAAVHHAARFGHDNVVNILSPLIDWTCETLEINAMHIAAAWGHSNVVESLLLKGVAIESRDAFGMTALHHASRNGHCLVSRLLLDRGCDVNSVSDRRYTALHFATMQGETETIKFLVARGAETTARTSASRHGDTPLHLAAVYAKADTVRVLVECGSPLEEPNTGGWTAWDKAFHFDSLENMVVLIELGARWFRQGVFDSAVRRYNGDILGILLSKIATMTSKERGRAALYVRKVATDENLWTNYPESAQTLRAWLAEMDSGLWASDGDDIREQTKLPYSTIFPSTPMQELGSQLGN